MISECNPVQYEHTHPHAVKFIRLEVFQFQSKLVRSAHKVIVRAYEDRRAEFDWFQGFVFVGVHSGASWYETLER